MYFIKLFFLVSFVTFLEASLPDSKLWKKISINASEPSSDCSSVVFLSSSNINLIDDSDGFKIMKCWSSCHSNPDCSGFRVLNDGCDFYQVLILSFVNL